MTSFASLITALGGPTEVAAALNIRPGTVQKMKDRDSIKPKHWPAFVNLARERGMVGITLESFVEMSAARNGSAEREHQHQDAA